MKSEKNWLIVTAVIVLLLCSIASYINRPLPAYIDTPKDTADENKSSIPEMSIYETDSLSFPYPASWRQILKSGNVTFLSSDGSYLMLQESTYNAQINNATESSVQQELAASGLTFIYFEKLTTSSFLLSYQEGTIYTWEYVMWDLDSEYRLILSYEDPSSYEELALYIFESFHWDKIHPIPENLFLVYSVYGNFEFAIPSGWTTNLWSIIQCLEHANWFSTICHSITDRSSVVVRNYTNPVRGKSLSALSGTHVKKLWSRRRTGDCRGCLQFSSRRTDVVLSHYVLKEWIPL